MIEYARDPSWIALHDPTTGEWHEVRQTEWLPSMIEVAKTDARDKNEPR